MSVILLMTSIADGPFASAQSVVPGVDQSTVDAEVLVDPAGRLVVVLDRAGIGEPGRADEVIVYQARGPLPPMPRRRMVGAVAAARWNESVTRFELRAGSPAQRRVLLEVDQDGPKDPRDRRVLTPERIELRGGAALARVDAAGLADATGGAPRLSDVEAAPWSPVRAADALLDGGKSSCASGGTGAQSCSANCKGAIAGVEIGETCSVSCGSGFYACCRCTGTFQAKAECQCLPGKGGAGSWFEAEEE